MSISQKMFRKFFYENSSFIESETIFVEISNSKLASKVGIKKDKICAIQNENIYSKFDHEFKTKKIFNLPL